MLRAVATTAFGAVDVIATHLSWVPWLAVHQLHCALDVDSDANRPTVILGDLNIPASVLRIALIGTNWRFAQAGPTFPAHKPRLQLDHILTRTGRFSDVRTGPAGPSDHRPLAATVLHESTAETPLSDRRSP